MAAKTTAQTSDKPAQSARPKAPNQRDAEKRQQEMAEEFMRTGVDFSPLMLDAGDGNEWEFTPDPMPAQSQRLSEVMMSISQVTTGQAEGDLVALYDEFTDAIRDRLASEKDRKRFPLPNYGTSALMWFGMRLATGRDGFPTE